MAAGSSPRVYTIPAGAAFVDELAAGLCARFGSEPLGLSGATVLLPTRRSCRALTEAFLRVGDGASLILPVMHALGDLDEEELGLDGAVEAGMGAALGEEGLALPPAIAPLRRHLLLTRLVLKFDERHRVAGRGRRDAATAMEPAQAARLARELARFLDQVHTEGLSFEGLAELVPQDYAAHWQVTLDFLGIVTRHWPAILAEEGCLDPAERRNRVLGALAARWRAAPSPAPVIAAGSTGSIPATAELLTVIAGMPQGGVVLPGLDGELDEDGWNAIAATHPQYGLKQLLERMGVARAQVAAWSGSARRSAAGHRTALLSGALRPATAAAPRHAAASPAEALDSLTRIDSAGPREEAGVIALLMREALETPERSAALVTPDRGLARRVAAELRRWGIEIDDSAGTPLGATVPGTFLRLTAALASEQVAPLALLACLKHPLATGGLEAGVFKAQVRHLETAALRGPRPAAGFAGLKAALAAARRDPRKRVPAGLAPWLRSLAKSFQPFAREVAKRRASLASLVAAHIGFAEWLAGDHTTAGADRLWSGAAGEAAAAFFDELDQAADALPAFAGASYLALVDSLLAGRVVRPRFGRHPRLHIWGLLEARLQQADLLVLGGLNEGTWPPEPPADPWLSRPMRAAFGLPPPERRTGLAAHDFAQAAAAPRVVLSRSAKMDGTPTVPSRWLLRLETYLRGASVSWGPTAEPYERWQALLDRPDRVAPWPRPSFAPPVGARPRRLPVTQVETWMRDPYAVYARHVLKLRPLDRLHADPGAAERGILVHAALERFLDACPDELPGDAEERLLEIGQHVFAQALAYPGVRAFWWPRFVRIASWFVATERDRRAEARPIGGEVSGALHLAGPAGPFLLTATADRIDRLADGGLALIDYKTGAVPTAPEVRAGLAPQLPLEAAIAACGGFAGVPAAPVRELSYWRMSGGEPAGAVKTVGDVDTLAAAARAGLERLIAVFDDPATPYVSRPRPEAALRTSDYDHLARLAEWSEAASEESA